MPKPAHVLKFPANSGKATAVLLLLFCHGEALGSVPCELSNWLVKELSAVGLFRFLLVAAVVLRLPLLERAVLGGEMLPQAAFLAGRFDHEARLRTHGNALKAEAVVIGAHGGTPSFACPAVLCGSSVQIEVFRVRRGELREAYRDEHCFTRVKAVWRKLAPQLFAIAIGSRADETYAVVSSPPQPCRNIESCHLYRWMRHGAGP